MITQSQTNLIQSDLLKLRSMSVPQNYRQTVHRIFDKKLRSYLSLQTKEEVLQHCQQLLINKTIDYMNITNEMESNQLKSLNSINKTILEKDNTISNLKTEVAQLKCEVKSQQESITKLNKTVQTLKLELECEKSKLIEETAKYQYIFREQEKNVIRMKSEQSVTKSSLEAKNKELEFELGMKTTQLKNLLVAYKEETTALRNQKEKNASDYNRKSKDMQSDHERIRSQLLKDKKYLQDLMEVKEDEFKRKIILKYSKQVQFTLNIQLEKEKEKEREKQKQRHKKPDQLTIRSRSKSTRSKPGKSVTFDNQSILMERRMNQRFPTIKQQGVQCSEFTISQSLKLFTKKKPVVDADCQTILQAPQDQGLSETEIRWRDYVEQKYRLECNEAVRKVQYRLQQQMRQYLLTCLRDAQQKISHLKLSTIQMIEIQTKKLHEIQQVYEERPSRSQDLQFIQQLIEENEILTNKCFKANTNADNAYIALQQYHVKLENYKQNVPITIVGNVPKINKKKSLRLELERKPSIRNFRMSSTCSNYLEKNHHHVSDSNYMTREVLLTECDSEMMSPLLKKKSKSRPNTGGNVGKFRRKSII